MADIRVENATDRHRYEARSGEDLLGVAVYERRGDVVVLTHTVVDDAAEGKGVGSALARTVLDAARADGLNVDPQCEFMAAWIDRHPDYADLIVEPRG